MSVDSSAEQSDGGTEPTEVTTTRPGNSPAPKTTGKVPKVLGIPIDYQPSEIQYMEVSRAEAYITRQVSELTLCAPAKCTIKLTRKYVSDPYPFDPPEGQPPVQCAVQGGEWVGPRVSGGTFQLIVLSPCGKNPSAKKTPTTTTSKSSSPATKTS
ncbi:hypothetical protein [Amycolatopsis sp. NPDC059657]|uniref:hypothetical protein n=1 Tax=Amycolatopsis sp. NPDC059657 TaxID=3346899 RepID=UPI003670031E